MTLKQTERLLQLLASHGVKHFKTAEVEVSLVDGKQIVAPPPQHTPPTTRPLGDITPSISTIPHEENRVASLLKLSDEALVDALFPDHTQPSED